MENIMLSCGCRAQSINGKGEPSCPTHSTMPGGVHPIECPNLEDRKARCDCGKVEKSSLDLAFFEFRGAGSRAGWNTRKNCRYDKVAHRPEITNKNKAVCLNFESIGSFEFDKYYCGCYGWD